MHPRARFEIPLPGGRVLALGERTLVMGILNVTPDSFAEPGPLVDPGRAAERAFEMEAQGADLIDIGGESTRPSAQPVSEAEELARVLPVLRRLAGRVRVPISIDTYKAAVARSALDEGAVLVNDISALRYDAGLAPVVAASGAAVILMHTRGRSADMYREAVYRDAAAEVRAELERAMGEAVAAGIEPARIILDPGIGFAKRPEHSFRVLAALEEIARLGRPVLVGPSRKSFLQAAIGERPPLEREWATAAAVAAAIVLGAHIVRVHAVPEMVQVARVADALRAAAAG